MRNRNLNRKIKLLEISQKRFTFKGLKANFVNKFFHSTFCQKFYEGQALDYISDLMTPNDDHDYPKDCVYQNVNKDLASHTFKAIDNKSYLGNDGNLISTVKIMQIVENLQKALLRFGVKPQSLARYISLLKIQNENFNNSTIRRTHFIIVIRVLLWKAQQVFANLISTSQMQSKVYFDPPVKNIDQSKVHRGSFFSLVFPRRPILGLLSTPEYKTTNREARSQLL